jgi:hypothetical protein
MMAIMAILAIIVKMAIMSIMTIVVINNNNIINICIHKFTYMNTMKVFTFTYACVYTSENHMSITNI